MATTTAALRAERRRAMRYERRRRLAQRALGILYVILLLLAFALAGTMDYEDRMAGLGGSYDHEWYETTMPAWLRDAQ